ncbi:MAG: cytidine deaminase [Anaerolineales bacterium]|nr:cytidine deaminase [Anaerolineales bacterium]
MFVMKTVAAENLTQKQDELVDAAIAVLETAYNPYSRYFVGAAVLTRSGAVFSASNVENAGYGSTICAERMAIGKANSSGARDIIAIAVTGRSDNFEKSEITAGPCGSCRQVIYEFSQVSGCDIEVILATADKANVAVTTIEELLPYAFGPKQLQMNISKYS